MLLFKGVIYDVCIYGLKGKYKAKFESYNRKSRILCYAVNQTFCKEERRKIVFIKEDEKK